MHARLAIPDLLARILGALVFLGGVWLLYSVYQSATHLLNQPAPALPTPAPTPVPSPGASPGPNTEATSAAIFVGRDLADYVKKLLALLLMCVAGALIASLGIKAIFSPHPPHRPEKP